MQDIIAALAPVFAAGLALQQALEWLDPILSRLGDTGESYATSSNSVIAGFALAWFGGFSVLGPLGAEVPAWIEVIVTGLVISGGTLDTEVLGLREGESAARGRDVCDMHM